MHGKVDWAVIADGGRMRILERAPGVPWREVEAEAMEHHGRPSRDMGSDRPGRVRESVGGGRHAVEPRQDLHDAAESAFARAVAARLEHAAGEGRYERVLVIAAPAVLGRLRHAIGPATTRHLAGSLDLDLTHLPAREIAARLVAEGLPRG
mgnify:CR=1 FL=1